MCAMLVFVWLMLKPTVTQPTFTGARIRLHVVQIFMYMYVHSCHLCKIEKLTCGTYASARSLCALFKSLANPGPTNRIYKTVVSGSHVNLVIWGARHTLRKTTKHVSFTTIICTCTHTILSHAYEQQHVQSSGPVRRGYAHKLASGH